MPKAYGTNAMTAMDVKALYWYSILGVLMCPTFGTSNLLKHEHTALCPSLSLAAVSTQTSIIIYSVVPKTAYTCQLTAESL